MWTLDNRPWRQWFDLSGPRPSWRHRPPLSVITSGLQCHTRPITSIPSCLWTISITMHLLPFILVTVTSSLPHLQAAATQSSGDESYDVLTPDLGSTDDFLNYPLPNQDATKDMTLESLVKHLEGQVRESQTSQARTRYVSMMKCVKCPF